jgi:uncharacterized protein involved in exopolysaccharide biosynthesis
MENNIRLNDEMALFEPENEIDLFNYFEVIWKWKWIVIIIFMLVVAATFIYTYLSPDIFEAKATIMPLKVSSGGALSSLLTGVPSNLIPSGVSGGTDITRFTNILKSRTLTEQVVREHDLTTRLYKDVPPEDVPKFQNIVEHVRNVLVNISDNKQGVIEIGVQATQPQLAADIANYYIEALRNYLNQNTLTEAKRNRLFIEEQYNQASRALSESEERLQRFKDEHKLFSLSNQSAEMVQRLGTIKGNLMAKQVEKQVMNRSGVSENNPQYEKVVFEIEALKKQMAELEQRGNQVSLDSVALEELPTLERQLAQLMREKTVQETLYSLLAEQYERAKIEEASNETSFTLLDQAIPPLYRIKPRRKLNLMLGGVLGLFLGVGSVFLNEYVQNSMEKRRKKAEESNRESSA